MSVNVKNKLTSRLSLYERDFDWAKVGQFAENKDVAREIRINEIVPALDTGEEVTLDFKGVDSATQSFVHALISEIIRKRGVSVLDSLYFKNCTPQLGR